MGVCFCKKHGKKGVRNVCNHICEAIKRNQSIEIVYLGIKLKDIDYEFPNQVCPACAQIYNNIQFEEDREKFLSSINCCCGDCFKDWVNLCQIQMNKNL